MERTEVIEYFDKLAPTWDAEMIRSDEKINFILDCGGVTAGKRVLDVACGTGALFHDYLKREVACVVGVDISPEMAKIAAGKYSGGQLSVMCADVLDMAFWTVKFGAGKIFRFGGVVLILEGVVYHFTKLSITLEVRAAKAAEQYLRNACILTDKIPNRA